MPTDDLLPLSLLSCTWISRRRHKTWSSLWQRKAHERIERVTSEVYFSFYFSIMPVMLPSQSPQSLHLQSTGQTFTYAKPEHYAFCGSIHAKMAKMTSWHSADAVVFPTQGLPALRSGTLLKHSQRQEPPYSGSWLGSRVFTCHGAVVCG